MSHLFDSLYRRVGYMFSLPERTLRSMAAMVGGTSSLLSEALFPAVLRGTTLYRVFLGDTQRFMIEKIAQVQADRAADTEDAVDPRFMQRKMAGAALETAGLFAMHLSPLWMFAIAADGAAGGGVFLDRLVNQLKHTGVIPTDARITGLSDLLETIQNTAGQSAAAVDTPPLSRAELTTLAQQMTTASKTMLQQSTNLLPRIETLWQRMQRVASQQEVSIEKVQGILAIEMGNWARKGAGTLWAVGQTGSALAAEQILDGYTQTLETVSRQGVRAYVNQRMTPFVEAAVSHFKAGRKSWTETLADKLFSPLRPKSAEPPHDIDSTPPYAQPSSEPDP